MRAPDIALHQLTPADSVYTLYYARQTTSAACIHGPHEASTRRALFDGVSLDVKARVLLQVQSFAGFNADNDPYNEHDFGAFAVAREEFFWKIDYYDLLCESGSEDPAAPEKTTRVLTIRFTDAERPREGCRVAETPTLSASLHDATEEASSGLVARCGESW